MAGSAAPRLASGRRSKFSCPRCGDVVRYTTAAYESHTKTWVCSSCLDQLPVDRKPFRNLVDAEALHHPRIPGETDVAFGRISGLISWCSPDDIAVIGGTAVVGAGATSAVGQVTMTASASVVGAEADSAVGVIAAGMNATVIGAEADCAAGQVLAIDGVAVFGALASTLAGIIGPISIVGAPSDSAAGSVSLNGGFALLGAAVSTSAGAPSSGGNIVLTGAAATTQAGSVTVSPTYGWSYGGGWGSNGWGN